MVKNMMISVDFVLFDETLLINGVVSLVEDVS